MELEGFKGGKTAATATATSPSAAAGDSDHVTYQLYYRPEQAKFSNNARVSIAGKHAGYVDARVSIAGKHAGCITLHGGRCQILLLAN